MTTLLAPRVQLRGERLHRGERACLEHQIVAVPGQFTGERGADAARRTGHQGERAAV